ncbi:hypothetical protein RchiOBHm_Chr6g0244261 [Rosa chinensis]|uniref:Uncharacterized protein n=1 Tax=Rosa chinensis TaxID=74649 RepID=A0A2P6PIY9_ROSCH|nr:hypothetical protein RchiOBHm_Chr6g0244261 [Rosa chinensis]
MPHWSMLSSYMHSKIKTTHIPKKVIVFYSFLISTFCVSLLSLSLSLSSALLHFWIAVTLLSSFFLNGIIKSPSLFTR